MGKRNVAIATRCREPLVRALDVFARWLWGFPETLTGITLLYLHDIPIGHVIFPCCRQGNWGAGKTCSRWWLTSNVASSRWQCCTNLLGFLLLFCFFFSAVCLVWPWKLLHILASLQVCICSILWPFEFSVSVRLQYQNWPGEGRHLITGFGIRNPGSMAPHSKLCEGRCFWQL